MNINELQSEDVLAQVSLDDIKGGNTEAIGGFGCCALNFSTNTNEQSPSDETKVVNCWLNFGQGSRWSQRRKQRKQRREQRRVQRILQTEM